MSGIKQQISQMRKSTPKSVQWLLLGVAFVVVLILMTMLIGGRGKSKDIQADDTPINLIITPETGITDWSNESINWANTKVGDKKKATLKVSATAPVKIMAVRYHKEIAGFEFKTACHQLAYIDGNISCTLFLDYVPTTAMDTETTSLFIDWRGASQPDAMKKTDKVVLVMGATAPAPVAKPEPVKIVETKPEPEIESTKPVQAEIKKDIEAIAPSDPFADAQIEATPSVACSEFAFPGYDSTGNQIGWIRPEHGAYYFHPFSDKKCNNPTGIYNPDSGLITDIKNNGKKIGTDAEHIGYTTISGGGNLPQLSNPVKKVANRAYQLSTEELISSDMSGAAPTPDYAGADEIHNAFRGGISLKEKPDDVRVGTSGIDSIFSSDPFDRTFVLRQYKPIPATIVSEVRADPELYTNGKKGLPVRATVDRNVYSDNGRTVIIPAGTLLLGYVTGDIPGPYKTVGRMDIRWYQFILPNGVEFNFNDDTGKTSPFSGDSQGRVGVPGYGSTDYIEQMVMPLLTAVVPAAVNLIAPITDKFVNQIDLDNNTVVQSGTVRSSELAKNEIITAWNQVAQKFIVDMMNNTVPPFSIAAGTRITVFPPTDLVLTCGNDDSKKCSVKMVEKALGTKKYDNAENRNQRAKWQHSGEARYEDESWTGQVRSFNLQEYCSNYKDGKLNLTKDQTQTLYERGIDYTTVLFYCQSNQYKAINNAKQDALYQNQQEQFQKNNSTVGSKTYNENVLGLKYNEDGSIQNPFQSAKKEAETATTIITCEDGTNPDANGCCTGEVYTDMGEQGFNCCPSSGGDCFPPIL